jgi:selenocysteine lyase/cysteine desulfurase
MLVDHLQLVRIDETREGFLDLNDLDRKLVKERTDNPSARMVGYFSAASCITGVLADDVATTLLLRQHGALSIWDYTSAGTYEIKLCNWGQIIYASISRETATR